MNESIKELHIASQYLAAAAISFIPAKADDSHTNLGWDETTNRLTTHVFGRNKNHVAFNLETGNLEWFEGKKITQVLDIEVSDHANNIAWLKAQGEKHHLNNTFTYAFHYELPYPAIKADKIFKFKGTHIQAFAERLSLAKSAFLDFVNQNNLDSSIRVWPHHFDMGIYALVDNEESIYLGAGLAIPDAVVDDLYFYAAAYKNGNTIDTKNFKPLSSGIWPKNWHGAVLASSNVDKVKALQFLNESKQAFVKGA